MMKILGENFLTSEGLLLASKEARRREIGEIFTIEDFVTNYTCACTEVYSVTIKKVSDEELKVCSYALVDILPGNR